MNVYTYQKFPQRKLKAGPHTFRFAEGLDETRVRSLFKESLHINDLDAFLDANGTQAFIVIQDDAILYERYFNGARRDTVVTSVSLAKSFTSALIGIAIADRRINGVDDPISRYLPELADRDARFSEITLRHLLMMSSGIEYVELSSLTKGDIAKTDYSPDLRRLALRDTRIVDLPGKYFLYNNYNPLLLGMALERATGRTVSDYLQGKVWKPLGMEYDGSWSLDSHRSGFEKMESGINACAIDFAKFGRLYLRNGNWEGRQIIPASWVSESTKEDLSLDKNTYYPKKGAFAPFFSSGQIYYKYFWWGRRSSHTEYDYSALGNWGQFLYVSPRRNLIIVRHGDRYGIDPVEWLEIFYRLARATEVR